MLETNFEVMLTRLTISKTWYKLTKVENVDKPLILEKISETSLVQWVLKFIFQI